MTRWPSIRVHATVGVSAANGGALGSQRPAWLRCWQVNPAATRFGHRRVGAIAHALCELRDLREVLMKHRGRLGGSSPLARIRVRAT
jgi:hypothetical protein